MNGMITKSFIGLILVIHLGSACVGPSTGWKRDPKSFSWTVNQAVRDYDTESIVEIDRALKVTSDIHAIVSAVMANLQDEKERVRLAMVADNISPYFIQGAMSTYEGKIQYNHLSSLVISRMQRGYIPEAARGSDKGDTDYAAEAPIPEDVIQLINEWTALEQEEHKARMEITKDPCYRAYSAWLRKLGELTITLDQAQPIAELAAQVLEVARQYETTLYDAMTRAGYGAYKRDMMIVRGKMSFHKGIEEYQGLREQL